MRLSRKMVAVEEHYGQPLVQLLPDLYNEIGLPKMAERLGIARGTAWYWLLKCGIELRRVALRPGESIRVEKGKRRP